MNNHLLIPIEEEKPKEEKGKKRANLLSGAEWVKYSMSVWDDIRKTPQENQLKHPAMFPEMLVKRLISCFASDDDKIILDPFMGSGSTLLAAYKMGKKGIGIDISQEYIDLVKIRIEQIEMDLANKNIDLIEPQIIFGEARNLGNLLDHEIDMCITSPPYWNILEQKRTADGKSIKNYGDNEKDLGRINNYDKFLLELNKVWSAVYNLLKPGGYLIINVMDLRKKNRFYPLHMDIVNRISKLNYPSFDLEDIIIWNRKSEYNNLRPLGYPYKFIVNKIHEYLLVFSKPKSMKSYIKKWEGDI
ncbi:MAG: site-specific DNA-methyltransferase [Candidatus Marinimicrobia bacterium]|nr:site-specific DNA-methyltransferase [Candidatus Neomarinimicrobiota bacterium]MBL7191167.1 site-specific DNA-methyltransferase [bacterium]